MNKYYNRKKLPPFHYKERSLIKMESYNGWTNWETWVTMLYLDYNLSLLEMKDMTKEEKLEWITEEIEFNIIPQKNDLSSITKDILDHFLLKIDYEQILEAIEEE